MMRLIGIEKTLDSMADVVKALNVKQTKSLVNRSVTPTVKKISAAAPIGTRAHKLYYGPSGPTAAPGFLSRNIKKSVKVDRAKGSVIVFIGPSAEAFYGQFLEKGTKFMDAQPFLKATFDADATNILRNFEKLARKLVEKAAK